MNNQEQKNRNLAWAEDFFEKLEKKLSVMTIRARDIIPSSVGLNKTYFDTRPYCWTSGFWGGLNVLMYERTGNENYLLTAKSSEKRQDEVFSNFELLHHDVGFMWHILSGALYRLTGDAQSKNRALSAAASLFSRFIFGGNFIRAWNDGNAKLWGRPVDNWTIIDCMMNLPLLYWASEVIGDDRFKRIAMAHADNTLKCHVRSDGSVRHIVEHDRETGELVDEIGGQGYGVGSSWSRGQAWAIYGFVLSYIHTVEKRYLDAAQKISDYFIDCCKEDWLVRTDFRAPKELVYYDTSAASCACCGFLELAKILPPEEGKKYADAAEKILFKIAERFVDLNPENDLLVTYAMERYPVPNVQVSLEGARKTLIYGDFFFVEAMLKLLGSEFNPWVATPYKKAGKAFEEKTD